MVAAITQSDNAAVRPWRYLGPPPLTAATRDSARKLRRERKSLIFDNGMFVEIGRISRMLARESAAVRAEIDSFADQGAQRRRCAVGQILSVSDADRSRLFGFGMKVLCAALTALYSLTPVNHETSSSESDSWAGGLEGGVSDGQSYPDDSSQGGSSLATTGSNLMRRP